MSVTVVGIPYLLKEDDKLCSDYIYIDAKCMRKDDAAAVVDQDYKDEGLVDSEDICLAKCDANVKCIAFEYDKIKK